MQFWWFNYRKSYYITHPWKWVEDMYLSLKYAYQRAFRGWDDTVIWSIDYYLSKNLPIWLTVLKRSKTGVPMNCFDDKDLLGTEISPEAQEKAQKLWNSELDKMIFGFIAAENLTDLQFDTDEEEQELKQMFDIGMKSFHKYYFSLWD